MPPHDKAHPDRLSAPFAVNQIDRSNNRLDQDLALCEKHKVPMIITSLGAKNSIRPRMAGAASFSRRDQPEIRAQERSRRAPTA
jgi:NAD(P)H-dependent flavin oxidoreductase YrpB (nitropropane dioxygenase family)